MKAIDLLVTKKCSKCKGWLPVERFSKNKARYDGLQNTCKCCAANAKRANPEQNRKDVSAWKIRNPGKWKAIRKLYKASNPEKYKAIRKLHQKRRYKRGVQELRTFYIKDRLCKGTSLKPKDIPVELVELKRKHLKIHRQLKIIKL